MIGVLLILNTRGDIVLSRAFRDSLSIRALADTFKYNILASKLADRSPINVVDRVAYFHMRFDSLYFVACSNNNANAMAIYQYLIRLVQLLTNFFSGEAVTEETLKEHFVLAQELIDETLDFGYPQITDVDALRTYIKTGGEDGEGGGIGGKGGIKQEIMLRARAASAVTAKVSGAMPWRNEGIVYRDNEAYLDVMEEINVLMSPEGEILQCDVSGVVKFRSFLSGMPRCELVLNDVASMMGKGGDDFSSISTVANSGGDDNLGTESAAVSSSDAAAVAASLRAAAANAASAVEKNMEARQNKNRGVVLDDVTFHPCVKLSAFGTDRTITFTPPDGEFNLMTYRTSSNGIPPISVLHPRVEEVSKTRMNIDFKIKADFPKGIEATDVIIKIPCPSNTANVNVRVKSGKAKYVPTEQSIIWKIKSLSAFEELGFSVEISLIAATLQQTSSSVDDHHHHDFRTRPPITVKFTAPLYAASGIKANKLNIREPKLGYSVKKWVRYQTCGGEYECRLGDEKKGDEALSTAGAPE